MRRKFLALGCAAALTFSMASTAFAAVSVATIKEQTIGATNTNPAGQTVTFLDANGVAITDQVVVELTVIPYENIFEEVVKYDYTQTSWGATDPELAQRLNKHSEKVKDLKDAAEVMKDTLAAYFGKDASELGEEDLVKSKILTKTGVGEAKDLYEHLGVSDYDAFLKLLAEDGTWIAGSEINAHVLSTGEKVTSFDDEYINLKVELPELEASYPDKDTFVGTIVSNQMKDKSTVELYTVAGTFEDGILDVNVPFVDGNFIDMYLL